MDVLEAIQTRRSVNRMTEKSPPRTDVEALIQAAVMAPNHGFTQPWRFYVVAGDERGKISDQLAEANAARVDTFTPEGKQRVDRARNLFRQAPVTIVVTSTRSEDKEDEQEDFAATWMAVQNLTLAAWGKGIATKLRTPPAIRSPVLRKSLGLGDDQHILGLLAVGYPGQNAVPPARERDADTTTWLGWS
ncbi:MAG: nitroreductase [Chloroflexota bacterium]|nr:nitroreductase [Chloroflexota bacterium]MDP6757597.1 nitroreductase [Chloroflexota bacterium]